MHRGVSCAAPVRVASSGTFEFRYKVAVLLIFVSPNLVSRPWTIGRDRIYANGLGCREN